MVTAIVTGVAHPPRPPLTHHPHRIWVIDVTYTLQQLPTCFQLSTWKQFNCRCQLPNRLEQLVFPKFDIISKFGELLSSRMRVNRDFHRFFWMIRGFATKCSCLAGNQARLEVNRCELTMSQSRRSIVSLLAPQWVKCETNSVCPGPSKIAIIKSDLSIGQCASMWPSQSGQRRLMASKPHELEQRPVWEIVSLTANHFRKRSLAPQVQIGIGWRMRTMPSVVGYRKCHFGGPSHVFPVRMQYKFKLAATVSIDNRDGGKGRKQPKSIESLVQSPPIYITTCAIENGQFGHWSKIDMPTVIVCWTSVEWNRRNRLWQINGKNSRDWHIAPHERNRLRPLPAEIHKDNWDGLASPGWASLQGVSFRILIYGKGKKMSFGLPPNRWGLRGEGMEADGDSQVFGHFWKRQYENNKWGVSHFECNITPVDPVPIYGLKHGAITRKM